MTDQPGCPCYVCDKDFGSAKTQESNQSDRLRDKIAAAIKQVDDMRVCKLSDADIKFMADAVADYLTTYLPPIFASAIHAYADSELMAMSYHGDPSGLAAMKKLNREAAQIANYATTHEKWNGKGR